MSRTLPMTTVRDCPDCDARLSAERIAERRNPDGGQTAWLLCSCCSKITKVVERTTVPALRAV